MTSILACRHHTRKGPIALLARGDWADARLKRGMRQTQCPDCLRWWWPDEMGKKPAEARRLRSG